MSKHFRLPSRTKSILQEMGVSVAAVLQHANLPSGLLDQPRILVSTEEFFAFWRGIETVSSNPAAGLTMGTETRPEHFDVIMLAALSTGSFGEAMQQMARYKQLSCPEAIHHETNAEEWSMEFRWLLADEPEPPLLTDLCFAWVLNIGRCGTGAQLSPLRIELTRPRTSTHARMMDRHFGCPIAFESARNAIVFRAADAARTFITRNADLLAMLAPQLDEELRQFTGQETFPEHVRATIQRKLTGRRPKIQEIARELRISSRTLQRRLQDAGSNFQQVLEDARHQLARHYLTHSALEMSETAYLLGYEDSNSFVRAFRTWEGVPPAHWRGNQLLKLKPVSY